MRVLFLLLAAMRLSVNYPHDIPSLADWGPYSKQYYEISHISEIESAKMFIFGSNY